MQTYSTITRSIRYPVIGSTGAAYTVSVDPCDARTTCTCPAGTFGKDCRHQKSVRAGEAGKPIVRISQRPSAARTHAPISDESRNRYAEMEV